jgi:HPr kinase/phosphorylase
MRLKLVAHLERPTPGGRDPAERLPLADMSEEILGITIRRVVIPVAAGRNLAVLIEAAVRNHILQLRGVDSMAEFMARQKRELQRGEPEPDGD